MGSRTKIQWTQGNDGMAGATWTPIRARHRKTGKVGWHCTKPSVGCHECYSEALNIRLGTGERFLPTAPVDVFLDPKMLQWPLKWENPRKIFVCSMTDLFGEFVPTIFIDCIFAIMATASHHTFQLLTKRSERMRSYVMDLDTPSRVDRLRHVISAGRLTEFLADERTTEVIGWPGYFVTTKGRVLSDRTTAGDRRADALHDLKLEISDQDHRRIMLQVEGRKERPLVHRLVLAHFDREPNLGEQGRHLDGDPGNNALWNLVWGTQSENWDDSKRHGTRRRYSKLSASDVESIRTRLSAGEAAYSIAKSVGVSATQIRNIADGKQWKPEHRAEWPLPSVWLGVSVEDERAARSRVPALLQTQAAIRFLSCEPLLEHVSLDMIGGEHPDQPGIGGAWNALSGEWWPAWGEPAKEYRERITGGPKLDFVIIGGESGRNARPFNLDWARSLIKQCRNHKVAPFLKQVGSNAWQGSLPDEKPEYRFLTKDSKGGDISEFPPDLQVREFPA